MANKDDYQSDKRSGNWEPDPYHRHDQRWWSGARWSEKVRTDRTTMIDPPGVTPRPINRNSYDGPATPISDARQPLRNISQYVPQFLLLGFLFLLATIVLTLIAVFN